MPGNHSAPRRESSWLSHLELLAGLPYPAPVLMPTLLEAVRSGFDADFGTFGWVEGEHLKPVAFWSERMTERSFRWFMIHFDEVFAELPLRAQLESDGDAMRAILAMPGYENSPVHEEILAPLGVRWGMVAPVLDSVGACDGFLYLYRRAEAGPFGDDEQARLRRASRCLRNLRSPPAVTPQPSPQQPAGTTTLHVDASGRLLARGRRAIELLYLCHDARMGVLDWAAHDLSALPGEPREMVRDLLSGKIQADTAHCSLTLAAGRFDFRAERLHALDGGAPQAAVSIDHLEPIDITVARQLIDWPLSPQEKRLVVASARKPSLQSLAEELNITVGTLKAYINKLQSRLGMPTRQALIDLLIEEARRERKRPSLPGGFI